MKTIEKTLEVLDLTPNEVSIYIYLLKKGVSLGSEIYKDNNLDKSSSYEALSNLNKKGLVYSIGEKRNQKFGAISAEKLLEMVENKKKELEQASLDINSLIENIDEYVKQHYKSKHIRIIEGENGFQSWALDRITAPEGSTIRELSSNLLQTEFIQDRDAYINYSASEMPKQRLKRNLAVKALMNEDDIIKFPELKDIEKTDKSLLKEVRLLPKSKDFKIECSLVTYGDKTAMLRKYKGEFLGLIIEDKLLTSLINSMFDFIWSYCDEV